MSLVFTLYAIIDLIRFQYAILFSVICFFSLFSFLCFFPIFLWVASTLLEFHFVVSIVLSLYKYSFLIVVSQGIPGGSDSKESACNVGDLGLSPELRRNPGEESGIPLQYSCLENLMDRGAWRIPVHGIAKSWTQLSD